MQETRQAVVAVDPVEVRKVLDQIIAEGFVVDSHSVVETRVPHEAWGDAGMPVWAVTVVCHSANTEELV